MSIMKLLVLSALVFWNPQLSLAQDSKKAHSHEEGEHEDEHHEDKSKDKKKQKAEKHDHKDDHKHEESKDKKKQKGKKHDDHDDDHKHDESKDKKKSGSTDDHDETEEGHVHAKGHDDEEKEHAHNDGEEEGEEASPAVGPNRGITSITSDGFTLAPEAAGSFEVRTVDFTGGSLALPKDSIVHVKDDVSVFRLRGELYKRVPVRVVKKGDKESVIESSELKSSDKVVSKGAAFLRVAEIAATGGVSHGHSH